MKSGKKYPGKFLLVMLALSLVTIMNGCKKTEYNAPSSSSGTPQANEVWMQNNTFNPSTITVSANTTITWRNKDSVTHTVTSDNGAFDSGNVGGGGTFPHQFTTAGTFSYHCTIHSGMTRQVTVH